MRAWLIANRYAVSAVALTVLCVVGLAMLVQPAACANPTQRASASPEPTLQPIADITSQPAPTEDNTLAPPAPDLGSEGHADGKHAPGGLVMCSSGGDVGWSTTADAFQVVCQCTITLPSDGWAFLSAGASLAGDNGEYEAHFRLGIDSTEGDPATNRWVNIYGDAGDGMHAALAVSALRPLKAGTHTFYLLCRRKSGTGPVLLRDPSLAVLASAEQ